MIMPKRTNASALILFVGLLAADLSAQGRSQGRGRGGDDRGNSDTTVSVSVVFRDSDRTTFRDYFATHRISAQALPPGIAKNVARGKPLPPGIAKRAVPGDLVALGPRLGPGVTMLIVGNVVVAVRNDVVIDVLTDVFR